MEGNLILFDIDGTLLDNEGNIPASTKESLSRLKELGHEVAIATGRAPFMFEELRKELDIHSYISFNGQLVVVQGEVIYKNPLKTEALELLAKKAEEQNHPIFHIDQYGIGSSVLQHEYIEESFNSLHLSIETVLDADYFKDRDILQSMLFLREKEVLDYECKFKDFRFVRWHPLSVDVDPKEGSKAKGVEKMMSYLGYSLDQLYALGDGLNDIEMLSLVPNSFAMGNAHPDVKKAAKFTTKAVYEDGVYFALKMAGLI